MKSPLDKNTLPPKIAAIFQQFADNYLAVTEPSGISKEKRIALLSQLLELTCQQLLHPYKFHLFHQSVRTPFDYYQFGLDFIRPLIDFTKSKLLGICHIEEINRQIAKGDNVIFFANHQIEPDPQVISLLLEAHSFPALAVNMIFVAGHRVIEDPLAIPLSMGRNLLCIYSKRHIDHPPEEKLKKLSHNQRTMKKMTSLLAEGGKCIYVAPSGGRDRPGEDGEIDVAAFPSQSIEMFNLMAKKAGKTTHFYPLALATYTLLPPPDIIEKELGEGRKANFSPAHLFIGAEINMDSLINNEILNKKEQREKRAEYIWNLVKQGYRQLTRH